MNLRAIVSVSALVLATSVARAGSADAWPPYQRQEKISGTIRILAGSHHVPWGSR